MDILLWIILSTFFISLIAFVGVLTLFIKEKLLDKLLLYFVALSAGSLLGGAFLHLIPEAIMKVKADSIILTNLFLVLLSGFCVFFILEQFISWHHHHSTTHKNEPVTYLILISDLVHNFIDGVVIAGSFIISVPVGIATTIAIALHEIPQEIGDFGVLVYGGFSKKKALFWNYISGMTAIIGGIAGFYLATLIAGSAVFILAFAAGNFIYIACSDLIPEIKHHENLKKSLAHFIVFLIGISFMLLVKFL